MRMYLVRAHAEPERPWSPLGKLASGGRVEYCVATDLDALLVRYDDWTSWRAAHGAGLTPELLELVARTIAIQIDGVPELLPPDLQAP
ncbi:hypothetical protein [Sandaracinus amylolyticus]|uniref:hypothetical protein n=1 Tax=Sandaracinus amylolyticus TaxID=927083 RepID=UPI001F169689|nr:hypothetical protein [Sandaracinus amylolyticus]UJR81512.1 Hypothetical protein I5071_35720 [Sandaracinus amylolyticus]